MLEALGFIMCPRPVQTNDFRENFGELVAHGKVVRHAASLSCEGNAAVGPTRSSPSRVRRFNAAVRRAV